VIPALIRKCIEAREANQAKITVWADGTDSREFLYVDDAAEAIVLATERYESPEPVNIGAGFEITIRDLAHLIAEGCGFEGTIEFEVAMPNGQPRRCLDVSRAQAAFDFRAATDFATGVSTTIDLYASVRAAQEAGADRTARGCPARHHKLLEECQLARLNLELTAQERLAAVEKLDGELRRQRSQIVEAQFVARTCLELVAELQRDLEAARLRETRARGASRSI
jgi:NAD dependent epimerase/dehydratase family